MHLQDLGRLSGGIHSGGGNHAKVCSRCNSRDGRGDREKRHPQNADRNAPPLAQLMHRRNSGRRRCQGDGAGLSCFHPGRPLCGLLPNDWNTKEARLSTRALFVTEIHGCGGRDLGREVNEARPFSVAKKPTFRAGLNGGCCGIFPSNASGCSARLSPRVKQYMAPSHR